MALCATHFDPHFGDSMSTAASWVRERWAYVARKRGRAKNNVRAVLAIVERWWFIKMRLQANDDYNRKIKWNVALQLQQLLSPSSPSREHPCILPLFKIYIYTIYICWCGWGDDVATPPKLQTKRSQRCRDVSWHNGLPLYWYSKAPVTRNRSCVVFGI